MKARIKNTILLLVCCVCLTGCTVTAPISQPTLEELLTEINAEHKAVEKERIDDSQYLRKTVDEEARLQYYVPSENQYDPEQELTQQQATEDVNYLFEAFYNCYALYDYFGGKDVFDAAQEEILQEIDKKETITSEELQDILLSHLDFIKDAHFDVNRQSIFQTEIPFFFREETFLKTEKGYQTVDGKTVDSVAGYSDLDELFKRSISQEGKLVYYPILLKECSMQDAKASPQVCDETLLVHYTDGTTAELTAEPYQVYSQIDEEHPEENQIVSPMRGEEILVFQFNGFSTNYKEEILSGADTLKNAPVGILDLRSNSGGNSEVAYQWMQCYAGETVPSHWYGFDVFTGRRVYDFSRKNWVSNENTLVVLTGKYTASASEFLLDMSYNLENTLIIGENTLGALLGSAKRIYLPNSSCSVNIGAGTIMLPTEVEYFEELRGFYPDIWVPASEAEELAVKLLQNIKTNE